MTLFHRYLFLGLSVFVGLMSFEAWAGKTHVGVAANFTAPAKEIAKAFHTATGHRAILSFGSTGKLYIQIKNGAPFSVFLAADRERPELLEKEGMAIAGKRFTYAQGKLVLYSEDPDLISADPDVLKQVDRFNRLAIANPKTAPYGATSVVLMKKLRVYEAVRRKIVKGDNIAQTYQFVSTQNAQLGFVAASQVIAHDKGSRWVVPQDLYKPIDQQAVLLTTQEQDPVAKAFFEFLQSDKARAIIQSYGYGTP